LSRTGGIAIEILEMRALRGPNRYSRYQVIYLELDLKEYEEISHTITERAQMLPGLPGRFH
jgi:hypothetical protein